MMEKQITLPDDICRRYASIAKYRTLPKETFHTMRHRVTVAAFLLSALSLPAQSTLPNWTYYCFGFLNAHPGRTELPQEEAMAIQKGHLEHMGRMARQGKLLVAGPFLTAGGPRGVVIYNCESVAEAEGYTKPDPAVVNKRLEMEFYRMHAVRGLGEPLATRIKADPEYKYEMVQLPLLILSKTDRLPAGEVPAELGAAHFERSRKLMSEGRIRFFGRFEQSHEKLGVYVFDKMTLEEAGRLMADDPMVKGGYANAQGLVWMVAGETLPQAGR